MISLFWCTVLSTLIFCTNAQTRDFPKGFKFGIASAAYQVEGAWNVSDKGENIWDHLVHNKNWMVIDGSTGDDATKSYQFYMRDVQAIDDLGVDFYRFSISWSRLLPTGYANKVSEDGLRYYNALIDALLQRNVTPTVTLYHWDLPQSLQELGGWSNPLMADYFREYAKVCFDKFGDRVKTWLTFNEPRETCLFGYGETIFAPALGISGIADYLCTHNLLRAHGMAYRLYDTQFRPTQKGRVGLTIATSHYEPATEDEAGYMAVKIRNEFEFGWYANPIFSQFGDYPEVMREMIAQRSKEQGFPFSRLPVFTTEEIQMLKGSSDFFGINHYTSYLLAFGDGGDKQPSNQDDHRTEAWQEDSWVSSASEWLKNTPWGFRKLLNTLKEMYNNPEIIVFENGWSTDTGRTNDSERINYYQGYLNAMLDAIEIDKVNVTGYTAWCLADNFEWVNGYTQAFGLYSTDFSDPDRKTTPKDSAKFYAEVVKTKQVPIL